MHIVGDIVTEKFACEFGILPSNLEQFHRICGTLLHSLDDSGDILEVQKSLESQVRDTHHIVHL